MSSSWGLGISGKTLPELKRALSLQAPCGILCHEHCPRWRCRKWNALAYVEKILPSVKQGFPENCYCHAQTISVGRYSFLSQFECRGGRSLAICHPRAGCQLTSRAKLRCWELSLAAEPHKKKSSANPSWGVKPLFLWNLEALLSALFSELKSSSSSS